jgi:hypothetical protein
MKNKILLIAENSFLKVARAGERTRDLLIAFTFSFHYLTAEPQRLPMVENSDSLVSEVFV